jgi:hypothetical protein
VRWRIGTYDRLPDIGVKKLGQWSGRLELFERIFGGVNIVVRLFSRSALESGCVVIDFCRTIGAIFDPLAVVRSNESLSADAVRFLFSYNRFVPTQVQPSFYWRMLLVKHLEELGGDRFSLHPHIFAPMAEAIKAEERVISDRYGINLGMDDGGDHRGLFICNDSDLFRFSPTSLEWLAKASGSRLIHGCDSEQAARQVANQLDRIRWRPSWLKCADMLRMKARIELRSFRHRE